MIEFGQGIPLIASANTVGDAYSFVGMRIAQAEKAGLFGGYLGGEGGCRYSGKGEAKEISPVHSLTP
jgi:hypothetical protein